MKHLWSILCSYYIENRATGALSLIEISDSVVFESEIPDDRPIQLPMPKPLYLVSTWTREVDQDLQQYDAKIRVCSPSREALAEVPFQIDLEQSKGCRTLGTLTSLPYTTDGWYELEIVVDVSGVWTVLGYVPIELIHKPPKDEQTESVS